MAKFGAIIIPYGVFPEQHELQTANIFNKLGKDVEFLVPVRTKGIHTPDIKMDGVFWEIKSPVGNGSKTLQHSFKAALRQSKNIVFDLRRTKIIDKACLQKLTKEFQASKDAKRLLVILKTKKVIDINK